MTKITTVDELRKKWNLEENRLNINDGWAHIIDGLLEVWKVNGNENAIKSFECKQRFGNLQLWCEVFVPSTACSRAEYLAYYEAGFTCEFCGHEGTMQTIDYYLAVACDPCVKKRTLHLRKKY